MIRMRQRLNRARREEGFTFVELAVSVGILGVGLLLVTALIANGLGGLLLGKQRAAANSVGQQVLEQARSAAYEDIGLANVSAVTSDPNIVPDASGSTYWFGAGCPATGFTAPPPAGSGCEQVFFSPNPTPPFDEHESPDFDQPNAIKRGPTTLKRWIYVTAADQDGDGVPDDRDNDGQFDLKRVTVRVAWSNPGVRGVDDQIRMETLIDPSRLAPPPVLSGAAFVKNGTLTSVTNVDGSVESTAHSLPVVDVSSSSRGSEDHLNCLARSSVMEPPSGSAFGPPGITTLADNLNTTTNVQRTHVESSSFADPLPTNVRNTLESPPNDFPGQMRCYSSVDNEDPLGPDLPDDALPYGRGWASNDGSPTLTYARSVNVPELENPVTGDPLIQNRIVRLFQVQARATSSNPDAEGITDTGPNNADLLVSRASQFQGELRFVRLRAGLRLLGTGGSLLDETHDFAPGNGLVHVESYDVTARANGKRGTTDPANDGSSSVSGSNIRIWVYDPALNPTGLLPLPNHLLPDSVCTGGRTGTSLTGPNDYCVIEQSIDAPIPDELQGLSNEFGLPPELAAADLGATFKYEISLTGSSSAPGPTEGPQTATWRAQANPLVGTARACITTGEDCESGRILLDVRDSFDLGTIAAEVTGGKP